MIRSGPPYSDNVHKFCRGWHPVPLSLLPQIEDHRRTDNEEQGGAGYPDRDRGDVQ